MSRLSDLYKAMETLRKEGLPVDENLERKANELEEDIINQYQFVLIHQCTPGIRQHQQMQLPERYIFFFHDSLLSDIGAKIDI